MKKFLLAAIALVASVALYAQQTTPFNGRIVNPDGKGLKAQLSIKGTNLVTSADKQGRFGFTSLQGDDILTIKCNKQVREVKVEGRQSLHIVWGTDGVEVSEDAALIHEGKEWVKRREYLNDMTQITGDDLRRSGAHSLVSALRARIPSIQIDDNGKVIIHRGSVQKSTGAVGTRAQVNFNALIVLDGQEIQSLNDVGLFDVGLVKVLDEAPLYGFRGVNGVIEITSESALKRK